MVLDARYTFPTTYQCLAPNHFLISDWLITRFKFLLPSKRPMDNMITGWDRPQEDEFALCNMGLPSPYLTMAFPNEPEQFPEYFTLDGLPPEEVARWKAGLEWFLKRVTLRNPNRIILKSPPHTGRIKTLLEVFPNARFVHIVRDPYALYGSTIKLWKTLYKFQGLQEPNHAGLEEYVFRCFERMYAALERDRRWSILHGSSKCATKSWCVTRSARCVACTTTWNWASSSTCSPSSKPTSRKRKITAPVRIRFPTPCAPRSTVAGGRTCAATAIASPREPPADRSLTPP